jgi:hypothetical protein
MKRLAQGAALRNLAGTGFAPVTAISAESKQFCLQAAVSKIIGWLESSAVRLSFHFRRLRSGYFAKPLKRGK